MSRGRRQIWVLVRRTVSVRGRDRRANAHSKVILPVLAMMMSTSSPYEHGDERDKAEEANTVLLDSRHSSPARTLAEVGWRQRELMACMAKDTA